MAYVELGEEAAITKIAVLSATHANPSWAKAMEWSARSIYASYCTSSWHRQAKPETIGLLNLVRFPELIRSYPRACASSAAIDL